MKLSKAEEAYYGYSGSLSNINRQLCFAGIAVIWIFAVTDAASISLPESLHRPLFFLILALTFDLLHYISATAMWGVFRRIKEKKGLKGEDEVEAPNFLNWPANVFFFLKVLASVIGLSQTVMFIYGLLK